MPIIDNKQKEQATPGVYKFKKGVTLIALNEAQAEAFQSLEGKLDEKATAKLSAEQE